MSRNVEVLAEGLGHPEGPDQLPDGRIVMVETYTSKIIAWSPDRGIHDYAACGGGPNACLLGSDGGLYITQNGGTVGRWRAETMVTPSIQRAWPDGRVEYVTTSVAGISLQAPNDLVFGPDGRLYFTDPSDYLPDEPAVGRLFVLNPDGTGELLEEVDNSYPNGIVAEPDGSIVWVESYRGEVFRKRPGEPSELIHVLPDGHVPDGLKIDTSGNFWITVYSGGGVDVVSKNGTYLDFVPTYGVPCNCLFVGTDLYVTDFGEGAEVSADAPMIGRLQRVDAGQEGAPFFRGQIAARA